MKDIIKKYQKELFGVMLGICFVIAYLLFASYYEYKGYREAQQDLIDAGCMSFADRNICVYEYDNLK